MRITNDLLAKAEEFRRAQAEYFELPADPERLSVARRQWQRVACDFAEMVLEQIELDACNCSCGRGSVGRPGDGAAGRGRPAVPPVTSL